MAVEILIRVRQNYIPSRSDQAWEYGPSIYQLLNYKSIIQLEVKVERLTESLVYLMGGQLGTQ